MACYCDTCCSTGGLELSDITNCLQLFEVEIHAESAAATGTSSCRVVSLAYFSHHVCPISGYAEALLIVYR